MADASEHPVTAPEPRPTPCRPRRRRSCHQPARLGGRHRPLVAVTAPTVARRATLACARAASGPHARRAPASQPTRLRWRFNGQAGGDREAPAGRALGGRAGGGSRFADLSPRPRRGPRADVQLLRSSTEGGVAAKLSTSSNGYFSRRATHNDGTPVRLSARPLTVKVTFGSTGARRGFVVGFALSRPRSAEACATTPTTEAARFLRINVALTATFFTIYIEYVATLRPSDKLGHT